MRWHRYLQSQSVLLLRSRGKIVLTDFDGTEGDHGTVDFIDNAINLFQIVGVRDDLVTGNHILHQSARSVLNSPHSI